MAGTWNTITLPSTVKSGGTFAGDTMLLLTDGSLLVHNAYGKEWLRFQPDPATGYSGANWATVYQESDMANTREYFATGVLADGRIFAIGGEESDAGGDTPLAEIFDPQTNTWSKLVKPAAFDFICGDCNGSILADGRVLLGAPNSSSFPLSQRTAIWDPTDDSWVEAGLEFGAVATTTKTDPFMEETVALLPDGSVLAPAVQNTPQAQRYVPSLDQWVNCNPSPVNLAVTTVTTVAHGTVTVEETGPVVVLPSGSAFCAGGTGNTAVFTPGPNPTDLGTWVQGPTLPADTSVNANWPTLTSLDAPGTLLPSGKVVFLGGTTTFDQGDYFSANAVFFEYDPESAVTTVPQLDVQPALPANTWTWQCNFLLLPTGQLLCSNHNSNTLFLYTPDPAAGSPDPSWKPANISVPATLVLDHTYTLTGTQLNGLSQANSYGDDGGMATNYPIVQLVNPSNGHTFYLRSHDFSSMGIATGAVVQSCAFDVPSNLTTGNWNLVVIANGIPSDSVPVQVVAQDCFFIVDNSTFSVGEIDTYVKHMPPMNAVFNPAFYVVLEGYTPAEIGLNMGNLMNPPNVPAVISSPSFSALQFAFAGPVIPEDPSLPNAPQRFTFPFSITFTDDTMFGASPVPVTLTANFSAAGNPVSNTATITLIPNPNPYILHGDQTADPPEPWYLSQDIRVFQLVASPGNSLFGVTAGTTGTAEQIATTFIQSAVTNLRNNVGTSRSDFDNMNQNEDAEVLQLLPNDPNTGYPVYNFAVARVRLRDTSNATNVRVFFRTWLAQQTGTSYGPITYARATNGEGQPIPVLGVQGDEIITIPYFAEARVSPTQQLHTQTDDFNRSDIDASAGETDFFFGCWLDINQPNDLHYPQRIVGVSADGPFNTVAPLFPIQQFMMAGHQCLVVEIAYDPDPIPPGADPSSSDKLAQRNLAFVGAPNPGQPASRRVPQTFEIRPTLPKLAQGVEPDELMIEWNAIPAGTYGEIYLPAVAADSILAVANTLYTSHLLRRTDAHTLRFPAQGVTYIPVPPGVGVSFAGLLTLDLPAGIHKGDSYSAVVRQITSVVAPRITVQAGAAVTTAAVSRNRQWRRTIGTFKLTIPVSTKAELLGPEEQYLSVMKWVFEAIPSSSRWYLVMRRYISQIAGRVTFMGGNPGSIQPSGTGIPILPPCVEEQFRFEGKIESLVYDCFGDFEAFTLKACCGECRRFESREPHMEHLVRRAWEERCRILVVARKDDPHHPCSVVLLC